MIAIVFDLPVELCAARNRARMARRVDDAVLRVHRARLDRTLLELPAEGLRAVHVLRGALEVDHAMVRRLAPAVTPGTAAC